MINPVSLSSWTLVDFTATWTDDELKSREWNAFTNSPFTFLVRPSAVQQDSKGLKVVFEVELEVASPEEAVGDPQVPLWAKLTHKYGLQLHGILDAGPGRCHRFEAHYPAGALNEEADNDSSDKFQVLCAVSEELRYNTRKEATGLDYRLTVMVWLRPFSPKEPEHTETLPLYFNSASPLPPPFLPYKHYNKRLFTSLTSSPFDVVFTVPLSLDPDSPRRTFYAHQKIFSFLPYFKALFADSSATAARRSTFKGREDLFELIGIETLADAVAEDDEQEEESGVVSRATGMEEEEDAEMTPAPGEDGDDSEGGGGEDEDDGDDAENGATMPRSPSRSLSPSPEKPVLSHIRTIDIPHATATLFELFHRYLYEKAAKVEVVSDFGEHSCTLPMYRFMECFAPDSQLEDQALEALQAEFTVETAADLLFSRYTRHLPRYRDTLFKFIKANLAGNYGVRQTKAFKRIKQLVKEPKTPDWQLAIWARLGDVTEGDIYKVGYW